MRNKRLGFGMMRLPLTDDNPEHIDFEKTCEMVDTFLEKGYTYFGPTSILWTKKVERLC